MSFGWSATDIALLVKLCWDVVQNSRKACGEYVELTYKTLGLYTMLERLSLEARKPESPINRPGDSCRDELGSIASGCRGALSKMDEILTKYAALGESERSIRKLYRQVRLGNGEMGSLTDLQAKVVYYTSLLTLFVNMVSMGSLGRVEQQMNEAGGDLREIKIAINSITAHLMLDHHDGGSVFTAYSDDDLDVWRMLRRKLRNDGFSSSVIQKNEAIIREYIVELGDRGVCNDSISTRDVDIQEDPLDGGSSTSQSSELPWGRAEHSGEGSDYSSDEDTDYDVKSDIESDGRFSWISRENTPEETLAAASMMPLKSSLPETPRLFKQWEQKQQSLGVHIGSKEATAPESLGGSGANGEAVSKSSGVRSKYPPITFGEIYPRVGIFRGGLGFSVVFDSPEFDRSGSHDVDTRKRVKVRRKVVRVALCELNILDVDSFVRENGCVVKDTIRSQSADSGLMHAVRYAVVETVRAFTGEVFSVLDHRTGSWCHLCSAENKSLLPQGYGFSSWEEDKRAVAVKSEHYKRIHRRTSATNSKDLEVRKQAFQDLMAIRLEHENIKSRGKTIGQFIENNSEILDRRMTEKNLIHECEMLLWKIDQIKLNKQEEDLSILRWTQRSTRHKIVKTLKFYGVDNTEPLDPPQGYKNFSKFFKKILGTVGL